MRTLARRADAAAILRRLRSVRPDSAGRWGRMSAHQMVCHLADGLRVGTGRKPARRAPGRLPETVLKWIALYAPLRWPAGVPTVAEIDQERDGTRPVDFAADVAELESLLGAFTAPTTSLHRRPHPVFGAMSHAAWLRWGYLHMDHHLRQFGH